MSRALAGLERHRGAALWIVAIYAVVTIRIHELVNGLVRGAQGSLGPTLFFALAWGLVALAGAALLWAIARAPRQQRARLAAWAALFAVAALFAYFFLFTVVSEAVHYLQYAILTVLLFPLARRIGAAMLWATLIGVVDEAHQYWVLHPDWGVYLDWNDIVVNAIGALVGGLCLAIAVEQPSRRAPRRTLSAAFVLTAAILMAGWALVATGKIALHAGASGARPAGVWMLLDRGSGGGPFWMTAEWAGKRFHVLSAPAGACLLAAFAFFAAAVDRVRPAESA